METPVSVLWKPISPFYTHFENIFLYDNVFLGHFAQSSA